ncbi:MAG: hypothetical protein LC798_13065 [Chloroflexi bacterium]|nr:hypothetical protein [Chloroflexota bacterium]
MSRSKDDLKQLGKNDLVREVMRLEAMLADQLAQAPEQGSECMVQGIVGMRDRAPIVTYRMGEVAWQQSPAGARMHALVVLDAAVEAQKAAAFLVEMRDRRKDWIGGFRSGFAEPGEERDG